MLNPTRMNLLLGRWKWRLPPAAVIFKHSSGCGCYVGGSLSLSEHSYMEASPHGHESVNT